MSGEAVTKDDCQHADRSIETVVDGTLRRPFDVEAVSMGDVVGDHDLDKALELAARLEDEEILRKLRCR